QTTAVVLPALPHVFGMLSKLLVVRLHRDKMLDGDNDAPQRAARCSATLAATLRQLFAALGTRIAECTMASGAQYGLLATGAAAACAAFLKDLFDVLDRGLVGQLTSNFLRRLLRSEASALSIETSAPA